MILLVFILWEISEVAAFLKILQIITFVECLANVFPFIH